MILRYNAFDASAEILRSDEIAPSTWNRITELTLSVEPEAVITSQVAHLAWSSVLAIVPQLALLSRDLGWRFTYEGGSDEQLRNHQRRREDLKRAMSAVDTAVTSENVEAILAERGFGRREGLREFQRQQVSMLYGMSQGANFSVPGAGKSTVALAVHALVRARELKLVIVAPKNAFTAWDDAVDECIVEDHRPHWRFRRLTGGYDAVAAALFTPHRNFIVSYDQLIRVSGLLLRFLALNNVHMILDESHRIKGGQSTARGSAIRHLQHLPLRRDILSGTPMPHSIRDIVPQISFLWPGERLGERAAAATNPSAILRPLYVRATKDDLGLPPPFREFRPVPMSGPQVALYSLLRSEIVSRYSALSRSAHGDVRAARRSIMRLLQVSSNPVLAINSLVRDGWSGFSDRKLAAISRAIIDEHDSPKIATAVQFGRDCVAVGRKVVIWSMFTQNIERIAELLSAEGSVYIHGGVDTGSTEDEATREYALERFRRDASCNVLVANPAACSEGISLHHVCHDALYVDRSFNAAHYLQSVDRIHRLGLEPGTDTRITVLESVAPGVVGSVDYSVRRRLIAKLRSMAAALADHDLELLALDEDDADLPLDFDIQVHDIVDVIEELSGTAVEPGADELT